VVDRDEALEALRHEVTGREFEFATVLEVTDGGPVGFLVRVRAGRRLHPHVLVLAADEQSLALDYLVGEPLQDDDVQLWAEGVVWWLMEQLDTGVLRWGRRITLPDGTVAIDPTLEPGPASPWRVGSVPLERPTRAGQRRLRRIARRQGRSHVVILGDIRSEPDPAPGGHLRNVGFDVRPGRTAHAEGRLVAWLQLHLDDRGGSPPVGQLVVAWRDEDEAVVVLEGLECTASIPEGAVAELMLAGVHAAAASSSTGSTTRNTSSSACRGSPRTVRCAWTLRRFRSRTTRAGCEPARWLAGA